MFRWLHRPVINESPSRDEIARAVRAVRSACIGRDCLRECVKRMAAAAPLRPLRRGGAAAVAAFALVCALAAHGAAVCVWQGDRYICSGDGSVVNVVGGGDGADVVITNVVGVCTNCVAMSPDYVREWRADVVSDVDALKSDVVDCYYNAQNVIWLLSHYTNVCEVSPWYGSNYPTVAKDRRAATNFLHSVGAYLGDTPANLAAQLTQTEYQDIRSLVQISSSMLGFYDGAAGAYNSVASSSRQAISSARTIESTCRSVVNGLDDMYDNILMISDEECTAQYDGPPSSVPGSGGGSSVVTNQVSGNWCTYEQGEAIKTLLGEIKVWEQQQSNYLHSISNRVVSIDETIKNALLTTYTHIPTEDELQTSWQELYLSGRNDNFPGYASTNIVARIELLLAGISGVLTNVNDYASQEEFADESLVATNLVESAMGDFTNQFLNVMQGRADSSRSVGDALVRLYQKFRTWSGTPFSADYIINSYSVEFESGKAVDVPGFSAAAETLPWANLLRVLCRSAMSVVWILMSVAVFVRFQIAFFQWCFKYVKWAVEVLQGLFV